MSNPLAWNGFALALPQTWEVTAYDLDADEGEFRINHRLQPRAQLTWKRYKKAAPDITRVLRDLHVRMCEQRLLGPEEPAMPERAGWTIARGRPQVPRHAARWLAERKLVLHLVVDPAASDDEFHGILDSWRTRGDGRRDHALFGMRAVLPEKFVVEHLVARPAAVKLIASGPRMLTVTSRRIGMARTFTHGFTLSAFYASLLRADGAKVLSAVDATVRGLLGAKIVFRKPGEHALERVLGAFWKGTGWLWLDIERNRLMAVEQIGPKRSPHLEIDDVVPREEA